MDTRDEYIEQLAEENRKLEQENEALAKALECFVWELTNKQKYGALEKANVALAEYAKRVEEREGM